MNTPKEKALDRYYAAHDEWKQVATGLAKIEKERINPERINLSDIELLEALFDQE